MSRRRKAAIALALLAGAAAFLALTRVPAPAPFELAVRAPDLGNGATMYRVGACFACHRPPEGTTGRQASLPVGGAPFPTPIGTFYPGNLTPDAGTGLGGWTEGEFLAAMTRGVSPDRRHYFPAFRYASYRSMTMADLLDLRAYLTSLPAVKSPAREAEVPLLALARRGVGLWKRLAFRQPTFSPEPGRSPSWTRGAYLANAPGHCGECHTPKDLLMVADSSRSMAGGPHGRRGQGREPARPPRAEEVQGRGRPRPRAPERRDPRLRGPVERRHGRHPGEPRPAPRGRPPRALGVPAQPAVAGAGRAPHGAARGRGPAAVVSDNAGTIPRRP